MRLVLAEGRVLCKGKADPRNSAKAGEQRLLLLLLCVLVTGRVQRSRYTPHVVGRRAGLVGLAGRRGGRRSLRWDWESIIGGVAVERASNAGVALVGSEIRVGADSRGPEFAVVEGVDLLLSLCRVLYSYLLYPGWCCHRDAADQYNHLDPALAAAFLRSVRAALRTRKAGCASHLAFGAFLLRFLVRGRELKGRFAALVAP